VPIDLLKEEQDRITKELANAGAVLLNTEVHWEALEVNLKAALGLATRFGEAYQLATPTERRWFNQAVLESVHVDVEGRLTRVELAEPFKTILDQDLGARLDAELRKRSHAQVGGSTIDGLVALRISAGSRPDVGPSGNGEGAPGLWCEPTSQKHLRRY
jgi:hypothetical protein